MDYSFSKLQVSRQWKADCWVFVVCFLSFAIRVRLDRRLMPYFRQSAIFLNCFIQNFLAFHTFYRESFILFKHPLNANKFFFTYIFEWSENAIQFWVEIFHLERKSAQYYVQDETGNKALTLIWWDEIKCKERENEQGMVLWIFHQNCQHLEIMQFSDRNIRHQRRWNEWFH